jgi:hypothetical protein
MGAKRFTPNTDSRKRHHNLIGIKAGMQSISHRIVLLAVMYFTSC